MTDPRDRLKQIPGVDQILEKTREDSRFSEIPRSIVLESIRRALEDFRRELLEGKETDLSDSAVLDRAGFIACEKMKPRLVPLINATGVVLHTNLGRALLCEPALDNIRTIARSYSNLELNVSTGKRGIRYSAVEELLCELTGAEKAMAVNNNAGAVFLALNTMAQNTEVVVSRGELVEIGGSFRVPDVMTKSGCILKEVGTTNRTHLRDYANAVTDATGLFLKVHTSNYKIEGFTASVGLKELVELGRDKNIPVMEDLGSGTLVDFSKYGLPSEPLVSDQVGSGADIVTFSGDKLLGGPQAGIIAGKAKYIDQIKANPLTRALRIDKLTLAALEATLRLYRDEPGAIQAIPTLRMLTMSFEETCKRAETLLKLIREKTGSLAEAETADLESRPGGGSFPELKLPTRCVAIRPLTLSVTRLEKGMRASSPPVIARIEEDRYILDPRTLQPEQENSIAQTLESVLKKK
ncbi:L-seryl-tRNA(Sec) selenium transferase [Desulfospira joergensenii]|uniref:L-seryl-tRNA(Sec) selenium transferase n=1 Tax=Desulfospira joergensenii TaxID=53329 RepID=UPI0003B74570|nr:L-seryl-tRNA(Sec) selenium transferase [Desulfospira joergensenii]